VTQAVSLLAEILATNLAVSWCSAYLQCWRWTCWRYWCPSFCRPVWA